MSSLAFEQEPFETGGINTLDSMLGRRYAGKHRQEEINGAEVIPIQQARESAIRPEAAASDERMEIPESILSVVRAAVERGENGYGDENCIYSEAGWWFFDRQTLTKFFDYQKKYADVTGCLYDFLFAVPKTDEDIRRRVATMDLIDSGIIFEKQSPNVEQEAQIQEEVIEATPRAEITIQSEDSIPKSEYRVVVEAKHDALPTPASIPGAKEALINPQIRKFIADNHEAIMAKWIEVVPPEVQAGYTELPDIEQAYLDIRHYKLPEVREHVYKIIERNGVPTKKGRKERNSQEHRLAIATVNKLRSKHTGGNAGFASA